MQMDDAFLVQKGCRERCWAALVMIDDKNCLGDYFTLRHYLPQPV